MRLCPIFAKPPSLRCGIAAVALALLTGCSLCKDNDGLRPAEWEARERARAAASLPRARRVLAEAMDSAWQASSPPDPTEQLRLMPEELFDLGGLYDFGGPLYAHSCNDAKSDPPSHFLLRHVRAALTADSLVIISGTLMALDTASTLAPAIGPSIDRRTIPLRSVTDAALRVYADTGFIVLRCVTPSATCSSSLPVALADSNAGRAFVAHLVAQARSLQMHESDPR